MLPYYKGSMVEFWQLYNSDYRYCGVSIHFVDKNVDSGNIIIQEQINVDDLGIDIKPRINQIKIEEPPKRKSGIKVASVAELVQKLKNEAKVI